MGVEVMSIPDSQLKNWMKPGANKASIQSHQSIRNAIKGWDDFSGKNIEIYLQGSYKNHTNIRGDSDVDVIVQLNDAFFYNLNEDQARQIGIQPAEYGYNQFYTDPGPFFVF